jgi:hypothetical protein
MMARPRVPMTKSRITQTTASAIHKVTLVGVYQWISLPPNSGLTMNWSIG